MQSKISKALVTLEWLVEHFEDENLILLDASVAKVVGKEPVEYDEFCVIPDSQFCDLDNAFHNPDSALSHTMPSAEQFSERAQQLGVNDDSVVVIYDNQGIYSAPRAWWMFKVMGFNNVFVLDGGLPHWALSGHDLLNGYMDKEPGNFVAQPTPLMMKDKDQIAAELADENSLVVDARSASRFTGTAKEPRPGLRSGHIPQSLNLHFAKLLSEDGLFYRSTDELKAVFVEAGITDQTKHYTISCGSGMTACIVLLAAYELGFENTSLYDGSWSEWGADDTLPIEL